MKNWLIRFQEFTGWAPLVLVLALLAWVFLGAIGNRDDAVRQIIEMPVNTLYILIPAGAAYLLWRRATIRLSAEQIRDHWEGIRAANTGDIVIYIVNLAFYLCAYGLSLYFFSKFR